MNVIIKPTAIALILGVFSANGALAIDSNGSGCGCVLPCPIIIR